MVIIPTITIYCFIFSMMDSLLHVNHSSLLHILNIIILFSVILLLFTFLTLLFSSSHPRHYYSLLSFFSSSHPRHYYSLLSFFSCSHPQHNYSLLLFTSSTLSFSSVILLFFTSSALLFSLIFSATHYQPITCVTPHILHHLPRPPLQHNIQP